MPVVDTPETNPPDEMWWPIKPEIALHFRDDLRSAKALALRDGEAFEEVVFAIERLGSHLTKEILTFGNCKYRDKLAELAKHSPLASITDVHQPSGETPFSSLYTIVNEGRNDALHVGAYARHLTANAVKLALVLEDALMSNAKRVRDFMVGNPTTASPWQTVCLVRQAMLANSFSYLPIFQCEKGWNWVSDFELAKLLRSAASGEARRKLLAETLQQVIDECRITLPLAETCGPDETITAALEKSKGLPVLVTNGAPTELLGIVTPFDLL